MLTNSLTPSLPPTIIKKLDATSNADAVATKAADAAQTWAVDWVAWSYSGAPSTGRLTIAIGSTTYVDMDIITGGPGIMRFDPAIFDKTFAKNAAVTITLYAGGSGVTGKVSACVR